MPKDQIGSGKFELSAYDRKSWAVYSLIFLAAAIIPELVVLLPFVQQQWPQVAQLVPLATIILGSLGVLAKKWLQDNSDIIVKQ